MDAESNLLVSVSGRAPRRSRREIVARLRALGDEAPLVSETGGRGVMTVRTTLDPRDVIRRLRVLQSNAPSPFRFIRKLVPVDLCRGPRRQESRPLPSGQSLLIEVFESSAALAVVSPEDVLTPALFRPSRPELTRKATSR
jgi:hypothetical protein